MAITQKDIAKMLGVHTATVSRALREDPSIPVALRARIVAVASELGYQPNYHARSLRSRETRLISILKKDLLIGEIHARWVQSVLTAAQESEYKVRIDRLQDADKIMREDSADGFIVFGDEVDGSDLPFFQAGQKPRVFIDCSDGVFTTNSVTTDNAHGLGLAVEHLNSLGHERIAFFGLVGWSALCRDRHLAYMTKLNDLGLVAPSSMTVEHYYWNSRVEDLYRYRDALLATVKAGATAMIASSDVNAVGAAKILRQAGYDVPGQISVVGFDDSLVAELCEPSLTTIRQDTETTARYAVKMLLNLMSSGSSSQSIKVPPTLVVRDSTGPVRS